MNYTYPVYVISGPSGVGKSTIVNALKACRDFHLAVSVTTRPPRAGAVNGEAYCFVSEDEFMQMLNRGELLEYTK